MSINIDGREYEVVETKVSLRKGDLIVRPVKQEPKSWNILLDEVGENTQWFRFTMEDTSEDQAQLIKESVEALMHTIMDDKLGYNLEHFIKEARQSLLDEDALDASGPGDVIPKGI